MRSDPPRPSFTPPSGAPMGPEGEMLIDCGSCVVRGDACGDCVVSVLLGPIGGVSGEERTAFAVLADSGLVPPLRLVRPDEGAA